MQDDHDHLAADRVQDHVDPAYASRRGCRARPPKAKQFDSQTLPRRPTAAPTRFRTRRPSRLIDHSRRFPSQGVIDHLGAPRVGQPTPSEGRTCPPRPAPPRPSRPNVLQRHRDLDTSGFLHIQGAPGWAIRVTELKLRELAPTRASAARIGGRVAVLPTESACTPRVAFVASGGALGAATTRASQAEPTAGRPGPEVGAAAKGGHLTAASS